jgi:pilus assembly protein CpaB
VGQKLDAQNVMLEEWPKDRVPEGAIFDLEQLEDQFTRARLYSGEPIMTAKLMDSTRGSDAITIPKGFRVVAVPVTLQSAVAGLLEPGDRVDLLVFFRKNAEISVTGTRTLLRNINVFSVDATTDRSIDDNGRKRTLKTVLLLVTPKQAETVMLGKELGTLFISLRHPDEEGEYISDGETVATMLGQSSETANEQAKQEDEGPGLTNWLNAQDATSQPQLASAREAIWKMRVLSGTGFREFEWTDENKLPTEVLSDQSVPPVAGAAVTAAASAAEAVGALQDDNSETVGQD